MSFQWEEEAGDVHSIMHWLAGEKLSTNSVPGHRSRKPLGSLIFSLLELCCTGLLLMSDFSSDWGICGPCSSPCPYY